MSEPVDKALSVPQAINAFLPSVGQMGSFRLLYSSIPGEDGAVRDKIASVVNGHVTVLWDVAPRTIRLENVVVVKSEELNQETGEFQTKVRLYLIDTDGDVYVTTSAVASNYLCRLAMIYGAFPWIGGREVTFIREKTRSGKEALTCTVKTSGNLESQTEETTQSKSRKRSKS